MQIGICSYSFHRLYAAGELDIFGYIDLCKELGCTQLDPWNAHLSVLDDPRQTLVAGRKPGESQHLTVPPADHVERIREAADAAQIPFGTIAIDGAHIYEPTETGRRQNRERADGWIRVALRLGATQVRIDAGGPEQMPDEIFRIIVDGYRDLIDRTRSKGIEVLVENHWGPTLLPENVERLMEAVEGLGLLFDTRNWKEGRIEEARRRCAKFARATHVKTRSWDGDGGENRKDVSNAIQALRGAGYRGVWGIESVSADGDEVGGARKTIDLLKQLLPA
jgi:sugar phosphate isomerase/epimerase